MKNINLEATTNTPLANFDANGHLILEGRSFPKKALEVYGPLIKFATQLKSVHVICDINLEYINTASTKLILELLETIENNEQVQSVLVNWHFEEGDDDSVEVAEIYEEKLTRTRFSYNEYAEV